MYEIPNGDGNRTFRTVRIQIRAGRVYYFSGSETHTQFLLNNVKDKPESKEHENIGVGD